MLDFFRRRLYTTHILDNDFLRVSQILRQETFVIKTQHIANRPK